MLNNLSTTHLQHASSSPCTYSVGCSDLLSPYKPVSYLTGSTPGSSTFRWLHLFAHAFHVAPHIPCLEVCVSKLGWPARIIIAPSAKNVPPLPPLSPSLTCLKKKIESQALCSHTLRSCASWRHVIYCTDNGAKGSTWLRARGRRCTEASVTAIVVAIAPPAVCHKSSKRGSVPISA